MRRRIIQRISIHRAYVSVFKYSGRQLMCITFFFVCLFSPRRKAEKFPSARAIIIGRELSRACENFQRPRRGAALSPRADIAREGLASRNRSPLRHSPAAVGSLRLLNVGEIALVFSSAKIAGSHGRSIQSIQRGSKFRSLAAAGSRDINIDSPGPPAERRALGDPSGVLTSSFVVRLLPKFSGNYT